MTVLGMLVHPRASQIYLQVGVILMLSPTQTYSRVRQVGLVV